MRHRVAVRFVALKEPRMPTDLTPEALAAMQARVKNHYMVYGATRMEQAEYQPTESEDGKVQGGG